VPVAEKPPAPGDSIYRAAQLVPTVLGIIYCLGIYEGADKITANNTGRLIIAVLAGVITAVGVVISCWSTAGKLTAA
jgi:hypothetical protein